MSRITTLVPGVITVLLGIAVEQQNIAFMVSLAFAVAFVSGGGPQGLSGIGSQDSRDSNLNEL
ncbi:hypothetical protein PI86_09480 [Burkholderia sp. A9]|uniref:hypothetical protein n=1 Tax=Burkholderia sp. A9 TaxID=1365108 RepID=UPI000573F65F|nr:hypothetical protein [Burkholderia sp. A9]KHK59533.1 hypothetical protein PI86_09480 [Burkholderia sp. A9]